MSSLLTTPLWFVVEAPRFSPTNPYRYTPFLINSSSGLSEMVFQMLSQDVEARNHEPEGVYGE